MASHFAKLVVTCVVTASAPASAQHIDYVGHVKASSIATAPQRSIGDPRYVALSECEYDSAVSVDVLDVTTQRVIRVDTPRATLIRRFGVRDSEESPRCQLVVYSPTRAAFLVKDVSQERYWYAEINNGVIGRTVRVAHFPGASSWGRIRFLGSDAHEAAAWFAIVSDDSRQITLRRLDLTSLVVTNEASVSLPVRAKGNGYEDAFTIKTSPDFTRFAIAEYDENGGGLNLDPPGRVFVVDVAGHTQFSVPAMSTTYGIAFTPDNHYMFLGSSQEGTIARVDLTTQKLDGTLPGLTLIHHLVVSPNGKHLFAIGSSKHYRVFDVPTLLGGKDHSHVRELAPAAEQMFGGGTVTTDGRYFVIAQALPPLDTVSAGQDPPKEILIARFVD